MSRSRWAAVGLVALGVALGVAFPIVFVLCVLVALNFVFGRRENVPFSTYPMFSQPTAKTWTLRFEDPEGALVPIGMMGINPVNAKKQFASEVQAAAGGMDLHARRVRAAEVLAGQIEARRAAGGPLASRPIRIVLVEYTLDADGARRTQEALIETGPR